MTNTLAGGTRPAAVIWPVKNRPNWLAASTTALQKHVPCVSHALVADKWQHAVVDRRSAKDLYGEMLTVSAIETLAHIQ